jgi:cyanophycin synthetase
MISNVWGGEPAAAITLPGDRRDDLVAASAEAVAAWFSRVVVYEDADKRGRAPGEMTEMITAALLRARPGITCAAADGPQSALRAAMSMAPGQPVLLTYEKLAMADNALNEVNARPWSAGTETAAAAPATRPGPFPPPDEPLRRADRPSQWNRGHR